MVIWYRSRPAVGFACSPRFFVRGEQEGTQDADGCGWLWRLIMK